ncbi:MAG: HlyC/CorC family transporter [Acidobacteria bacterium]|nr:HlyC/CorC family transporter [Acidobacteriota bacterium]
MIPLIVFLLACAAVYLGTIEAAFSALMRLPLRIVAERSDRPQTLSDYLDDPLLLFVPVRLLLGVVTAGAAAALARGIGIERANVVALVVASIIAFVVVGEVLLPLLVIGRNPERVLEILLPSFRPVERALSPLTRPMVRAIASSRRPPEGAERLEEAADQASEARKAYIDAGAQEGIIQGEERRLLQSIVDFGDTLVREVMTPRPDVVAIQEDAAIGDLRALFREQEYSRFPVYRENLDNIAGFVFVKDLVGLHSDEDRGPITPLLRQSVFVPETKRVSELLKQFQRQQTQCAIVVDEYGGTAGLVTIEDLLEEIVGEIRDEYDVETEPIVDEGGGCFVFSGKVAIDAVAERLGMQIERHGFATLGGYLLAHLGRVPIVGERFDLDGLAVEVLDVERRRVSKVRMAKTRPDATVSQPADGAGGPPEARARS